LTSRPGAIVLAGGRSSRFGRDKLREPVDGVPLLERAIDAVRLITDEIVLVVGVGDAPSTTDATVRLVHDDRPFEGPLAALAIGLAAATSEVVIVVGGDMPTLVPAVLIRLAAAVDASTADAAILDADGTHRPLPMAVRRSVATPVAAALVASGERRLRALRDALIVVVVPDAAWHLDDPTGVTLRDIDTPADL
jgi:molybdopterin-guanine dinucleotide biosynthesis protein A